MRRAAFNALGTKERRRNALTIAKRGRDESCSQSLSSASRSFQSQWWEIKTQACKEGLELRKWKGVCSKVVKSIWSRKSLAAVVSPFDLTNLGQPSLSSIIVLQALSWNRHLEKQSSYKCCQTRKTEWEPPLLTRRRGSCFVFFSPSSFVFSARVCNGEYDGRRQGDVAAENCGRWLGGHRHSVQVRFPSKRQG